MICRKCGEAISDSSKKCPRCGTENPNMYTVSNPYAPAQQYNSSPERTPVPSNPVSQPVQPPPPVPTTYAQSGNVPPPAYYGVPVQKQAPSYAPLPYSNPQQNPPSNPVYYPVPQVKPKHTTRNIVLAVVIPIAAVLIVLTVLFSVIAGLFRSNGIPLESGKGGDYNPYVTGETVVATGEHYDSQFEGCICTSEITLQQFVTGELANNYMSNLGADLSLLDSNEEYAVARFQVKLLENNTINDVYYGSYDFYLYDNRSEEFMEIPSYDDIEPESIRLSVGQTGEVVIFAVVPKNADLQALYYTEDSYLCFAPEKAV